MSNEINLTGSFNNPIQDVHDSNINITQILGKSAQYQDMLEQLRTLEKYFLRIPEAETEERLDTSQKIEKQKQFIELFKADVLRLAEQFNRIEINTGRLMRAKEFFDNGEFDKARNVLEAELKQMQDEQAKLLDKQKEYESEILPKLKNNSEEYLILALSTGSNYANPNWLAETCDYFEQSIKSHANENNMFQYALFLQKHNQFDEAENYYQLYLQKFARSLSIDSRATTLNNLAILHSDKNEYEQALAEYDEALSIRRNLAQSNPSVYLRDVARTLNNLGFLHFNKNEYEQGLVEYEEALMIYRNLAQKTPSAYLPDLAATLNNLAILHNAKNEYEQALSECVEALSIRRNLAQSNPSVYLRDVAATLNNLAILHFNKNEYEQGLVEYEEALMIYRNLAQKTPSAYLPDLAATLNNLAILHRDQNEYEQALAEYEEALSIRRNLAQSNPLAYLCKVAMSLNNLANLRKAKNEYEQALVEYEEALAIYRNLVQASPSAYLPDVAATLNNLANLHNDQNEYDQALIEYEEALGIKRQLAQANPAAYLPDVAMTLVNLSMFYLQANPNQEKSVEQALEAITIVMPIVEKVPYTQRYLQTAVNVLRRWGWSKKKIQSLVDKHSSQE